MNKYLLFGMLVFLLVLATYMVDVTDTYSVTQNINTTLDVGEDATIVSVFSMLSTFIKILTFQIEGFPAILNLLFFYPISAIVLYMTADIIKDIIPFT